MTMEAMHARLRNAIGALPNEGAGMIPLVTRGPRGACKSFRCLSY